MSALAGVVLLASLLYGEDSPAQQKPDPARTAAAANAMPVAATEALAETRKVLQLRYKITKPCTIYLNHPARAGAVNPSWTFKPGRHVTVKWRYNADRKWAVISVGGRGYPHWGFTDRTPATTCLGKSIRQPSILAKNPDTGKFTIPVAHYPAGRAVPSRIGEGRSRQAKNGWLRVDQTPSPAKVTRRGVRTDGNATLRDRAGFVLGNLPVNSTVEVTRQTHGRGHWTKVRVPTLRLWAYIESRALPSASATAAVASTPVPAASLAPTPNQVCHWKVIWPAAGVYPTPNRTKPLKTKHNGDVVGQSCTTTVNTAESETYVRVDLGTGGTGWMRRNALHPA